LAATFADQLIPVATPAEAIDNRNRQNRVRRYQRLWSRMRRAAAAVCVLAMSRGPRP
jgi:hypothetical protein